MNIKINYCMSFNKASKTIDFFSIKVTSTNNLGPKYEAYLYRYKVYAYKVYAYN